MQAPCRASGTAGREFRRRADRPRWCGKRSRLGRRRTAGFCPQAVRQVPRAVENACRTSGSPQPLAGIRAEPIAVRSESSCLRRSSEAGRDATSSSPLAKCAAASRLADLVIARWPAFSHHGTACGSQAGQRVVLRHRLRLGLGDVGELGFQRGGDPSMDLLAPAFQQALVGGVAHQRVLERVGRLRRRAAAEHQLGLLPAAAAHHRAASGFAPLTAASSRCWKTRPMQAPIWAVSLTGDSRSSRAISESCSVEGIASAGSGPIDR